MSSIWRNSRLFGSKSKMPYHFFHIYLNMQHFYLKKNFPFSFKDFIYLFLDRGGGRKKERERNINVWLPLMNPLLGTWPATQACALTGNRTGNPLVHRLALNPLNHTSQGRISLFNRHNTITSPPQKKIRKKSLILLIPSAHIFLILIIKPF